MGGLVGRVLFLVGWIVIGKIFRIKKVWGEMWRIVRKYYIWNRLVKRKYIGVKFKELGRGRIM